MDKIKLSNTPLEAGNIGMTYYKILKNFILILSAILNLSNAISYLIGYVYEDMSPAAFHAYEQLPILYTIDYIYGGLMLVFSLFTLYVRHNVANFKSKAPSLVTLHYFIYIAVTILYPMMQLSVAGLFSEAIFQSIIPLVLGIFIVRANSCYFEKRRNLFIN